jgi:hypothetical protein
VRRPAKGSSLASLVKRMSPSTRAEMLGWPETSRIPVCSPCTKWIASSIVQVAVPASNARLCAKLGLRPAYVGDMQTLPSVSV